MKLVVFILTLLSSSDAHVDRLRFNRPIQATVAPRIAARPSVVLASSVATKPKSTKPPLAKLLAGDVICAFISSVCLSPFVATIDKAIIQYVGGASMLASVKSSAMEIFLQPLRYARRPEFLYVLGVYVATYTAANAISTICEHHGWQDSMPKLIGVSGVNMAACLWKDAALACLFGTQCVTSPPLEMYCLFAVRDALTVASSFTIPPIISSHLQVSN